MNELEKIKSSVLHITNFALGKKVKWPWFSPMLEDKSYGTGFVASYDEKIFIITNQHVIENSCYLEVSLVNNSKIFSAEVVVSDPDCDLAILSVEEKFFEENNISPLVLSDQIPDCKDKVLVVGFPDGDRQIHFSDGIISKIKFESYASSGIDLLVYQTTGVINTGNSGGPVLNNKGEVIGVAFQGPSLDSSNPFEGVVQNSDKMIPVDLVKRLLNDVIKNKYYKGIPGLGINIQRLNSNLIETGVRISKIDKLSPFFGKTKVGDILTSINGYEIDSMGQVPYGNNPIDFTHLINTKQIGDVVSINYTRGVKKLEANFNLTRRLLETKYVSSSDDWKEGCYFINGGMVYAPLTNSILTEFGDKLDHWKEEEKEKLYDEKVVLLKVLPGEFSRGYDNFEGEIVEKVNGLKVNNFKSLIKNFHRPKSKIDKIILEEGEEIITNRLSNKAQINMLYKFGLKRQNYMTIPKAIRLPKFRLPRL